LTESGDLLSVLLHNPGGLGRGCFLANLRQPRQCERRDRHHHIPNGDVEESGDREVRCHGQEPCARDVGTESSPSGEDGGAHSNLDDADDPMNVSVENGRNCAASGLT
jgi:hypothetical protein